MQQQCARYRVGLAAVAALELLKKRYSVRELSAMTGLPTSTLARYTAWRAIPHRERAEAILSLFSSEYTLLTKIIEGAGDYWGLCRAAAVLAFYHIYRYKGGCVDTVVAIPDPSLAIAALLADMLGATLVTAFPGPLLQPHPTSFDCLFHRCEKESSMVCFARGLKARGAAAVVEPHLAHECVADALVNAASTKWGRALVVTPRCARRVERMRGRQAEAICVAGPAGP